MKKESKNVKILIKDDEHKIALFSKEETKGEKKDLNKDDKDNNKDNKKDNNTIGNPFSILVNKENEQKEKAENNNQKSLFGNIFNNNNNNQSLFGNIDNNNTGNAKSLFSIPIKLNEKEKDESENNNNIFDNKDKKETKEENKSFSLFGNTPLFSNNGGKSLFNNNDNDSNTKNITPLLFSNMNNTKNPFADIKGDNFVKSLFSNNKTEDNKKNNSEQDGALFGGDDGSEKSDENDKPKTKYVAEPLKAQDYSQYSKFFSLNLNNLFLYNKTDKKYVSKGTGFFSIEKTKDEKSEKHQAVVVFRNHAGNKLVEGFLDNKFNKFDIFSKEFNYVVCFGIIMINEGKPDIGFIKIPFKNEDNANELKEAFEKAMEFIKGKN